MNIEEFKKKLQEKMSQNRRAFEGRYIKELNGLISLSKAEIDEITPDTTDLQIYDALISVVKEASAANISQGELKERIMELGEIAIKIAKKVPSIASFFA